MKPVVASVTIHGLVAPMRCSQTLPGGHAMNFVTAIPVRKHNKPVSWPVQMYTSFCTAGTSLQAPFLLAVRLYWGWQFAQTGWGKLHNLARITEFFRSLGIPFPAFNAH